MRKTLSIKDYLELLRHIQLHHSWISTDTDSIITKRIKYINASFDTRQNAYWRVELNGHSFALVNENKDRDLKEWIYEWLNS